LRYVVRLFWQPQTEATDDDVVNVDNNINNDGDVDADDDDNKLDDSVVKMENQLGVSNSAKNDILKRTHVTVALYFGNGHAYYHSPEYSKLNRDFRPDLIKLFWRSVTLS